MGKAKNLKKRVASYQRNESPPTSRSGYLLPTLRRERNPSEAENSSRSSSSLRSRFSAKGDNGLGSKTASLVEKIDRVESTVVASELEALLLEANLIKKYSPPYNVAWKDGRAYPFIKITVDDKYPAVLQSRKIDDISSKYFGPYPNIGDVRKILKMLRRIFPYQGVKNHPEKICLYYHLGLCPCPPVFDNKEQQEKYRHDIRMIISLLSGKKAFVLRLLTNRMKTYAQSEDFEEAELVRKQITTINLITQPVRNPLEYMENPNLMDDEAALDVEALRSILEKQGILTDNLSRIECYDISNIQGKQATGSMVVATNGIADKSQYRLFKIKLKDTPDDVAMIKEVLRRRLKHNEWSLPNLIVVDGGINQVNAAKMVIGETVLTIPVIGLAKREEEIIIPRLHPKGVASTIRLARNNRPLKLLQRLRDEAHRFALAYHRKLRKKTLFGKI